MTAEVLFPTQPTLATERLRLRPIGLSDAEAVFAIFSDPEVMRFYGHLPHRSIEQSVELIRQQTLAYERREAVRWGITAKDDERVIGSCGLYRFDEGFHRAETGYELNRSFWGRGFMGEALGAVLDFAFDRLGLHRVEAMVDEPNGRSASLLRRLGFTLEGTLRQRFFFGGTFYTELFFGLLGPEWQQHRRRLPTPHALGGRPTLA